MKIDGNDMKVPNAAYLLSVLTSLWFLHVSTVTSGQRNATGETTTGRQALARRLPPLLVAPADYGAHNRGAVRAIFATNPAKVVALPESVGTVAARWTRDHRFVVTAGRSSGALRAYRYDEASHRFTGPLSLDETLGRRGGHYQVDARVFDISSGGSMLTFIDPVGDLTSINLATGVRKTLVSAKLLSGHPQSIALSPDGTRFAYSVEGKDIRNEADETYDDLWVSDMSGTHQQKLGHGWRPAWDTTGRRILCIVGRGQLVGYYDLRRGHLETVRKGNLESLYQAVFSPDGRHIAMYEDYRPGSRTSGLYLTDLKGRIVKRIATFNQMRIDPNDSLAW